jgi:hypothetical protein
MMAPYVAALIVLLVTPASSFCLFGWIGQCKPTCPTLQVKSGFNLTEWIRASWYMHRQQVNGYQPADQLYCVVATYNESFRGTPKKVPLFSGKVITVYNNCNKGKTNGPVSHNATDPNFKGGFGDPLCARDKYPAEPAKIVVAPCPLPNFLAGNYWVVEAGPAPDNYEYGIIIAGQPTVQNSDGCTTPSTCSGPSQTGCGLWVVTRSPAVHPEQASMLEDLLHKKGISTQDLITVDHTGCKYEGYFIKENKKPVNPLVVKENMKPVNPLVKRQEEQGEHEATRINQLAKETIV